jgi:hypothetical protein
MSDRVLALWIGGNALGIIVYIIWLIHIGLHIQ